MPFLKLNRYGRVDTFMETSNQCKEPGHIVYDYKVSVVCCDTNTDQHGFIIDHVEIDRLTRAWFTDHVDSCEMMTQNLAKYLKKKLNKVGVQVVDIYVRIIPVLPDASPNRAYMEFSESGKF